MGRLKPGATYIYERDGKNIYARESGSLTRELIGYDYPSESSVEEGLRRLKEEKLWIDILHYAKTNHMVHGQEPNVILTVYSYFNPSVECLEYLFLAKSK